MQYNLNGDSTPPPQKMRYGRPMFAEDGALIRDFIAPPFSVLDVLRGYWQIRKRYWESCGIRDGGRKDELLSSFAGLRGEHDTGTSKFDPVIAEISYGWFCPVNGTILDPFSGGPVRGSVAAIIGHRYTGIDLSSHQVDVNRRAWDDLGMTTQTEPTWICGDACNVRELANDDYDLIFSCPPYFDLERYSDDPHDLSTMTWENFCNKYYAIISDCVAVLKDNRFAVWYVGDVRDGYGFSRNFVGKSIDAFTDAGMELYNDIIVRNSGATGSLRARGNFRNRKVTNVHQHLLVFYKGDPAKIQDQFSDADNRAEEINDSC